MAKVTNDKIKAHLIKQGVENMISFGYPHVTKENILVDEVYKMFFKNMLNQNLGEYDKVDVVINEILKEIDN